VPAQTLGIATRRGSLMLRAQLFFCRGNERPASKFRPTMHFPYLVIPICSLASNAIGSHRAPPHATL
jgi:hypothetical protein